MKYIIGTRGSRLALAQAESVCNTLQKAYSEHTFEIQVIRTTGDKIPEKPLKEFGNKGVFVREIEEQLLAGTIDIGVHSMKDMPVELPDGLCFARAWKREDARDVLVLRGGTSFEDLPPGAVIGTGSIRRELQIRALRPDIRVVPIRGNVDTRLRKMREQKLDGIVLAAAGLNRLGMKEAITCYLEPEQMIPAPAQGALALEIRESDSSMAQMLDALCDEETEQTVSVERAFLEEIGADCHMPVGAYCRVLGNGEYELRVMLGKENGARTEQMVVRERVPELAVKRAVESLCRTLAGTVTLVGAGPGDEGLITVKGLDALKRADCILYDRLSSPFLLSEAKRDCELLYVGKESGHPGMGQQEINALLIKKALQYEQVVRLKGGDPFVFGRGAEEVLALGEKGISTEVVPGISSCLAGPLYAGIPVTHRGMARGFQVVTARGQNDEPMELDFEAMARSGNTCIFLMGLEKLGEIAEHLMDAGMAADTEAAVVSRATTGGQRVCVAELGQIEKAAGQAGILPPALIVVGKVVSLQERLQAGKGRQKLCGKRYLVTKTGDEPSELAGGLRALGASVQELKTGDIRYRQVHLDAEKIRQADWLVFTSRNGVNAFFSCMRESGVDVRGLTDARVAAIGKKTAEALRQVGFYADFIPEKQNSDALAAGLREILRGGEQLWCIRPAHTGHRLKEALSDCCVFNEYILYENETPSGMPDIVRRWEETELRRYDGIVFTCASSVQRLYSVLSEKSKNLLAEARHFSIGPKTTEALKQLGIRRITEAADADYEGLINVIVPKGEENEGEEYVRENL